MPDDFSVLRARLNLGVQPEPINRISILATGTDLGVGTGPSMGLESRSRAFLQSN